MLTQLEFDTQIEASVLLLIQDIRMMESFMYLHVNGDQEQVW